MGRIDGQADHLVPALVRLFYWRSCCSHSTAVPDERRYPRSIRPGAHTCGKIFATLANRSGLRLEGPPDSKSRGPRAAQLAGRDGLLLSAFETAKFLFAIVGRLQS